MTPKQLFAPSTTLSHATPSSGQKTQNFGQPTTFSGQTNPFFTSNAPFFTPNAPCNTLPLSRSTTTQLQPHNHTFLSQPDCFQSTPNHELSPQYGTNVNTSKSIHQPNTLYNKKTSRRKIQRKKKRFLTKKLKHENLTYVERLKAYNDSLHRLYGFVSNPTKSKKYNFDKALETINTVNTTHPFYRKTQETSLQIRQPNNLTVHNLCCTLQPPHGTTNLLGLGLKYCIVPPRATPNIKECMQKLAYKIRTKHHLLTNDRTQRTEYIPQLYIKLKKLVPTPRITDHQRSNNIIRE